MKAKLLFLVLFISVAALSQESRYTGLFKKADIKFNIQYSASVRIFKAIEPANKMTKDDLKKKRDHHEKRAEYYHKKYKAAKKEEKRIGFRFYD